MGRPALITTLDPNLGQWVDAADYTERANSCMKGSQSRVSIMSITHVALPQQVCSLDDYRCVCSMALNGCTFRAGPQNSLPLMLERIHVYLKFKQMIQSTTDTIAIASF